jgi:hypothetical protein
MDKRIRRVAPISHGGTETRRKKETDEDQPQRHRDTENGKREPAKRTCAGAGSAGREGSAQSGTLK